MNAVTASDILKAIEKANAVNDVNALEVDKLLSDQGVDSLDFSGVLFNLEEAFNIEIPDEDIDGLATINDLVQYVNNKK